jgi:hypothetical protein
VARYFVSITKLQLADRHFGLAASLMAAANAEICNVFFMPLSKG